MNEEKIRLLLKLKKVINTAISESPEAETIIEQLKSARVNVFIELSAVPQPELRPKLRPCPYDKKWPTQMQ